MATIRRAPLTHWAWAVVAVVVLMGGALLTTVWTTYASVRDASAIVVRGQADALQDAVRAELAGADGLPTSDDLAAFLDEQKGAGLRYIAIVDPTRMVS